MIVAVLSGRGNGAAAGAPAVHCFGGLVLVGDPEHPAATAERTECGYSESAHGTPGLPSGSASWCPRFTICRRLTEAVQQP